MRRAQDRARSATIKSRALGALKLARDENVPVKRADFFNWPCKKWRNSGMFKLWTQEQCYFRNFKKYMFSETTNNFQKYNLPSVNLCWDIHEGSSHSSNCRFESTSGSTNGCLSASETSNISVTRTLLSSSM